MAVKTGEDLAQSGANMQVRMADVAMSFKVGASQMDGDVAIHEWSLDPHRIGAPPHRHEFEDEIFYVLEGEVTVMQDEEVETAGRGSYVTLPRGHFHTFWNAGDVPARMLVVISPGGLEEYFREASALFRSGGPPDMAAMGRLLQEYGLTMQFERMPEIMARHGLQSDVPPPPQ
jgi:mannose-6-phosphate isomerase-like protein (cupin superfamily)